MKLTKELIEKYQLPEHLIDTLRWIKENRQDLINAFK